jgi:succinate-acetate transporter protein
MAMTVTDHRRSHQPDGDEEFWRSHATISLSPIAAPSILGLFGFAASTFAVAAHLAGWYGDATTPLVLAPFVFAFGGLAQLLAGMWAFRARDGLATGIHGAWGAYWIAFAIYQVFVATGLAPGTDTPAGAVAFGYWFIGLAAITWTGVFAALAEGAALTAVLLTLAAGATLLAIGLIGAVPVVVTAGAYVLIASAVIAWYTGSAMMLESTTGRVVLPVGKRPARRPGQPAAHPIEYALGEPGVKVGQ